MATVFLGVGSNESPEQNLRLAIKELSLRYGKLDLSPVYRSASSGFVGADFLNLVIRFQCEDSPLAICQQIELIHNLAGRVRGSDKWDSRPLDIDLLLYNDLVADEKPVRVPRDDVLKYSFVLRPIAELAPDFVHPVTGRTLLEHWREFDAASHPLEAISVNL
ncbi:MAG: 2-amino-4-hydroxy-6-hydroxymethyldihydropteridine diphosphokinase [Woeseiaceae bacterium]|nr:2-amino-4-hydroxy-6-hydroxymethyldihydropteridine diphosphokinase [Woeseiaceae bacterium]